MSKRPWSPEEIIVMEKLIADGKSSAEVASVLKRSKASVDYKRGASKSQEDSLPKVETGIEVDLSKDTGSVVWTTDSPVRTVEDAMAKAEVDTAEWEVERSVVNSWEVAAIGSDGVFVKKPLWQIKLWLKRKKGWSPKEFREILIQDIKSLPPLKLKLPKPPSEPEPLLAELSIFDAHFGKMAWKSESGANYDVKIAEERYMSSAVDLLARAKSKKVEKVLYVVGQDFYHTDQGNMTAAGTPQDVDGRWQKTFRIGVKCAIETIMLAREFAEVHVIAVSGNHDLQKMFMLGELLDARFHDDERVTVQNDPSLYSYYRYGTNLIMFTHGHTCNSDRKREALVQTMSEDRREDWAETTNREIHLGHRHSEHEDVMRFRNVGTIRTVAIRTLPSISSTDAWHREQNYKSMLAAELHYYHRDKGRFGYEVFQIQE
jgi:hypothetical protein